MDLAAKEAIEIRFWETSPVERPGSNSLENLLMKAAEARVFVEKLKTFNSLFAGARDILELGGGQGWASCIVKRSYPGTRLTLTDISSAAIASVDIWERVFGAEIEDARACRSYETPFPDASFDLIFAFSAAHHFVRHRRTLQEIRRLLRPGGSALYLYEPGCLAFSSWARQISSQPKASRGTRGCTAISGNRGSCAKGWARSQGSAITQPNE